MDRLYRGMYYSSAQALFLKPKPDHYFTFLDLARPVHLILMPN